MDIALHDADDTKYPNLALMKLSAWHKGQGDNVSFFEPISKTYDKVYSSKVFTFTKKSGYLPVNAELGGSGYVSGINLPEHIEHICPDYSLYGIDYSMGFLTRGCSRKCEHCIVPVKEGWIREHADIEEFVRHKSVVLMDNNVLAHPHGIKQIEKIGKKGIYVDFNQGLDARLIDRGIARILKGVKWLQPIRLACDSLVQIETVRKAITVLRCENVTPRRYSCYVLVKDIVSALERVEFLKGMFVDPFAQPYRDREGTEPTEEQRAFARWVNMKANFNSLTWEEYKIAYGVHS